MGKVYRAEDTRLGREVAIKVLPEAVARDPERLARFEREARVLAAFAHPRIAAVHEFGVADGVHFLVMELAAGETLAERIARGALPVFEALPIALQIAEALEAAHERGIVHRDLKPANVKVSPDGAVKVLDFGLAKALEMPTDGTSEAHLTHSPTLTGHATRGGVLLCTAAYMSPEQAAGRPADRRSDVWAFGVVLLEMLTGRQAFTGESASHVLASVLKDEPAWGSLERDLPPRVLELLRRCLRKEPKRRLQAIGEARVALEDWLADPGAMAAAPAAVASSRRRTGLLPWAVAAVLAAALAVALWLWRQEGDRPAPEVAAVARIPVTFGAGESLALGLQPAVAMSRDGRRQLLVVESEGTRRLLLRDLDQVDSRLLPGSEGASSPFFSPDGEWVGFVADETLKKMSLAGGPPITLAAAPDSRGAAWSEDGTIFFSPGPSGGLQRISAQGGEAAAATELDGERGERTHRWPHVVPGGRAALYTSVTFDSLEYYDDARIEALVVASGERKVILEGASRAEVLGGHLVFARGGSLLAVPFDAAALEVEGQPVPVLTKVATSATTGAAHFALSATGSGIYVPGDLSDAVFPRWADRRGGGVPAELEEANYVQLRLAPDDRRAALVVAAAQDNDVWVADFERGTTSRLTFGGLARDPVWTPDGRSVAFSQRRKGADANYGIYVQPADGAGEPEVLWTDESVKLRVDCFSPDGTSLVFSRLTSANQGDLWLLPLAGDRAPRPLLETSFHESHAEVSPDGRWLAYASNESGRSEVFVRPFPGPGGKWQVSSDGGLEPHWSHDGRELFYRTGGSELMRASIAPTSAFAAGRPERLFAGVRGGVRPGAYAVARDGRFLYLSSPEAVRLSRAVLLLDWASEVERLSAPRR